LAAKIGWIIAHGGFHVREKYFVEREREREREKEGEEFPNIAPI